MMNRINRIYRGYIRRLDERRSRLNDEFEAYGHAFATKDPNQRRILVEEASIISRKANGLERRRALLANLGGFLHAN